MMKGRKEGFRGFRDILASEMSRVFPELRPEIGRVVESTSGDKSVVSVSEVAAANREEAV